MKEIYWWVPWFRSLAHRVAEGGPELLVERAKRVEWKEDDSEAPLLRYGDENIDPFSFFYYLAARSSTAKSRQRIYPIISERFGVSAPEHLHLDEAFYFPQPRPDTVLFHEGGTGNPKLLWDLFRQATTGIHSVQARDFESALKIPRVALSKLTQTLFLVNPEEFLSFDNTGVLPLGISTLKKPVEIEWPHYRKELDRIRNAFPGCWPYEINMLAYLHNRNKLVIGTQQCFQISANVYENGDLWEDFRDNNWVYTGERRSGRGWNNPSPDDPGRDYPLDKPQPGDVVLVRYKREGRGIGVVYRNDYGDRLAADSRLHVLWLNKSPAAKLSGNVPIIAFSQAGETTVDAFRQAVEYTPTFELLDRFGGKKPEDDLDDDPDNDPDNGPPRPTTCDIEDLAHELLVDSGHLRKIQRLLEDKRQVIFQGPPGTGKTFVARKLATCLAGNEERVRLVQFHPSYAYEDFVHGIRPILRGEQPCFKLRPGPLLSMAEQARKAPDDLHFLVIDEINRGNLAKVFGELYFLLEYRDHQMQLQYSDELFALPKNLYFIGTMNTAVHERGVPGLRYLGAPRSPWPLEPDVPDGRRRPRCHARRGTARRSQARPVVVGRPDLYVRRRRQVQGFRMIACPTPISINSSPMPPHSICRVDCSSMLRARPTMWRTWFAMRASGWKSPRWICPGPSTTCGVGSTGWPSGFAVCAAQPERPAASPEHGAGRRCQPAPSLPSVHRRNASRSPRS